MPVSTLQSTLQIGGFNPNYFSSAYKNVTYLNFTDTTIFWNVNMSGFRVGKSDFFSDFTPAGYKFSANMTATLDTGTTQIMVPTSIYSTLMSAVLHNNYYIYTNGSYYGPCFAANYSSIYIAMNGAYFEVPPSSYVVLSSNPNQVYCQILL